MKEKYGQDSFDRLGDYAPTKLVKNDVKKSYGFSQRYFPLVFAVGLHGLFLWWISAELALSKNYLPEEIITVLEFLDPVSRPPPVIILPDVSVSRKLPNNHRKSGPGKAGRGHSGRYQNLICDKAEN